MLQRKRIRERGKIKFSRYFKDLKEGDRVAIVRELSLEGSFPKTLQGRTGIVCGKRGNSCIVNLNIGSGRKFIIHPVHLKKLE